jgi:hypothetical protein
VCIVDLRPEHVGESGQISDSPCIAFMDSMIEKSSPIKKDSVIGTLMHLCSIH